MIASVGSFRWVVGILVLGGCVTVRGGDAPLELFQQHIYVQAMIGGHGPYRMLLDTGAAASVVCTEVADDLKLWGGQRGKLEGVGYGSRVGHLDAVGPVEVGGASVSRVEVWISGPRKEWNVDGLLGSSFLERFRVVVDYPGNHVTFVAP